MPKSPKKRTAAKKTAKRAPEIETLRLGVLYPLVSPRTREGVRDFVASETYFNLSRAIEWALTVKDLGVEAIARSISRRVPDARGGAADLIIDMTQLAQAAVWGPAGLPLDVQDADSRGLELPGYLKRLEALLSVVRAMQSPPDESERAVLELLWQTQRRMCERGFKTFEAA